MKYFNNSFKNKNNSDVIDNNLYYRVFITIVFTYNILYKK